jgi:hypothetical protein
VTVVDVNRKCLVELPEGARYIALSYVWGVQAGFVATKERLRNSTVPGCLSDLPRDFDLPDTVRDAIHLAGELGLQYCGSTDCA